MKTDLICGKMQLAGEVGVEERIQRSDVDVPKREDGQVADDGRILGEDFRLHAAGFAQRKTHQQDRRQKRDGRANQQRHVLCRRAPAAMHHLDIQPGSMLARMPHGIPMPDPVHKLYPSGLLRSEVNTATDGGSVTAQTEELTRQPFANL
jgi:hypothetical protein